MNEINIFDNLLFAFDPITWVIIGTVAYGIFKGKQVAKVPTTKAGKEGIISMGLSEYKTFLKDIINKFQSELKKWNKQAIMAELEKQGEQKGITPSLLKAMAEKETSMGQGSLLAKSDKSTALGILQVTKTTFYSPDMKLNQKLGFEHWELVDPVKGISAGIEVLKKKLAYSKGDLKKALASYGSGEAYAIDVLERQKKYV